MFKRNKLALATGLLGAALGFAVLPTMAEVLPPATPAVPAAPVAPAPATVVTTPLAPVAAPVAVPTMGGLPDLVALIKQNSAAVVNISVEGKAVSSAYGLGLPDGLE